MLNSGKPLPLLHGQYTQPRVARAGTLRQNGVEAAGSILPLTTMRPAPSLIAFSTLSGVGFGALAWAGLEALAGAPVQRLIILVATVLAVIGLLSSVTHLGKPLRAWRALTQWRSSWLSREAWAALASLGCAALLFLEPTLWPRYVGAILLLTSVYTVVCTAMIYHSLPPVPAWTIPSVPAIFVTLSAYSGAYLILLLDARRGYDWPVFCALMAIIPATQKLRYWSVLDAQKLPSASAALGLSDESQIEAFEAPHTQRNYLLHEMVFKVGRKHRMRLRRLSVLLAFVIAPVAALMLLIAPNWGAVLTSVGMFAVVLGLAVERWLFFAEARHMVERYYAPSDGD